MPEYHLVVSVPPHDEGWDPARAAPCLGITAAEIRVKAKYQAPEIWFGGEDEARAEEVYQGLQESGLNVAFTDTGILESIPPRQIVKAFQPMEGGILWDIGGASTATPAIAHVKIVYVKPTSFQGTVKPLALQAAGKTPASSEETQVHLPRPGWMGPSSPALVDIYFRERERMTRLCLVQGGVSFSGLGRRMQSTFGENCAMLRTLLGESFAGVQEDIRLMDITPRPLSTSGVPSTKLAACVQNAGAQGQPLDLASRLVCLTSSWV